MNSYRRKQRGTEFWWILQEDNRSGFLRFLREVDREIQKGRPGSRDALADLTANYELLPKERVTNAGKDAESSKRVQNSAEKNYMDTNARNFRFRTLSSWPGWRNWQTQRTQNPSPSKGVWVRDPLRAPGLRRPLDGDENGTSALRLQDRTLNSPFARTNADWAFRQSAFPSRIGQFSCRRKRGFMAPRRPRPMRCHWSPRGWSPARCNSPAAT